MSTDATNLPVKSTHGLAVERTDLAQVRTRQAGERTEWARTRTRQAAERTMMAIVRTSLSLISFGFTIYKVFEAMREKFGAEGPIRTFGPRRLGLALVSLGVLVLVAGTIQHWGFLKELQVGAEKKFPFSVSLAAALILTIVGAAAFVTILARM